MTISIVQVSNGGGSFSQSVTFASPVTVGNTIVYVVSAYQVTGTATTSAVTLGGSTVTGTAQLLATSQSTVGGFIWMLPHVTASGQTAVTCSFANCDIEGAIAYEVAGLGASPALDRTVSNSAATGTAVASGTTPAITSAPEIIFGCGVILNQAAAGPGGGWTAQANAGGNYGWSGYQIATSSGGTYSWSQTGSSSGAWAAGIVTVAATQTPVPAPFYPARQAIRARMPQLPVLRGREASAPGAPARNPHPGPQFRQATQAVRAKLPQQMFHARGRVSSNPGVTVAKPAAGPVFRPRTSPARFALPAWQPRAGRVGSSFGAPVANPAHGPPAYAPQGPARARLPQLAPRAGRVTSGPGTPARNPSRGPVFVPAVRAVRTPVPPVFSKGRVSSGAGTPARNPAPGPVFRQAVHPARAVVPQVFSKGRAAGSPGAPVRNPASGPAVYPQHGPARAPVPRTFSKGRVAGNAGAPVVNPAAGPAFRPRPYPVRAAAPLPPRGRTYASFAPALIVPTAGPPFCPAPQAVRARAVAGPGLIYASSPPAASGGAGLALDPSTPAVRASGFLGAQSESWTSNSFSPPAGSVITVTSWSADGFTNDWSGSPSITDSLGTPLTWTLAGDAFSQALAHTSQRVAVFWAYCPSPQSGMTVTVTDQAITGQVITRMAVAVKVWAGASTTSPIGAFITNGASPAAGSVSQAITPTQAGSALLIAGGNQVAGTGTPSAGSGCFLADALSSSQVGGQAWLGTSGGPALTTSLSPQTLGLANTGSTNAWQYIAYEVLPAPAAVSAHAPYFFTGRTGSSWGAPVQNQPAPGTGPALAPGRPVRAYYRPPARGRISATPAPGPQGPPPPPPTPGPPFYPPHQPVQAKTPVTRALGRGRVASGPGGPVANPGQSPVPLQQVSQPAGIRVIYLRAGSVQSSPVTPGPPPPPPTPGPVFFPARSPARAHPVPPPRGRVASGRGGPVQNPPPPVAGPVFRQATSPARIRPSLPLRGRITSSPGAPVRNPHQGAAFPAAHGPVRAPVPQVFSKGRIGSNPGGPVAFPVVPAPVYPLHAPVAARRPLPPHGRAITGNPGAPVRNPQHGQPFRSLPWPARTRIPQNAPRGRTSSNPGGPVENIPVATLLFRLGSPYFQWDTGTPGLTSEWSTGTPVFSWAAGVPETSA